MPLTPPVTVPQGQSVVWSFPSAYSLTQGGGGTVTATLSSGLIDMESAGGLGDRNLGITWSGFTLPGLPPGYVINNMYPVMELTNVFTASSNSALQTPSWFPGATFSGQVNGTSLGNTLATLTSATISPQVFQDGFAFVFQKTTILAVGIALYVSIPPQPVAWVNLGNTKKYP